MLLPLQGDGVAFLITQGDALGYVLLPFQGVLGHFDAVRFVIFKQTHNRITRPRCAAIGRSPWPDTGRCAHWCRA